MQKPQWILILKMTEFINNSNFSPYSKFYDLYKHAELKGQKDIEAICISSYDIVKGELDSRYVNLKYVKNDELIFFTNYSSPKSKQFEQHNQVSISVYWSSIDAQIRFKANIRKTSRNFNQQYFSRRAQDKNALAISSNQSEVISSYKEIQKKYEITKLKSDLTYCPLYWGGYAAKPYEIEFWEGHHSRLNKRDLYKNMKNGWKSYILQP